MMNMDGYICTSEVYRGGHRIRTWEKIKTPEEKAEFDAFVSRQLGIMAMQKQEERLKKVQ